MEQYSILQSLITSAPGQAMVMRMRFLVVILSHKST